MATSYSMQIPPYRKHKMQLNSTGSSLPDGRCWTVRPAYVASPGCRRGQRGPRCSIHARRNLPDKAFGSHLLLCMTSILKNRGGLATASLPVSLQGSDYILIACAISGV